MLILTFPRLVGALRVGSGAVDQCDAIIEAKQRLPEFTVTTRLDSKTGSVYYSFPSSDGRPVEETDFATIDAEIESRLTAFGEKYPSHLDCNMQARSLLEHQRMLSDKDTCSFGYIKGQVETAGKALHRIEGAYVGEFDERRVLLDEHETLLSDAQESGVPQDFEFF
jgi:hypothetical protein